MAQLIASDDDSIDWSQDPSPSQSSNVRRTLSSVRVSKTLSYADRVPVSQPHPDDSKETFEIEDFTAVSPWERLVSDVEKKLGEWGCVYGNELDDVLAEEPPFPLSETLTLKKKERTAYILEYHSYDECRLRKPAKDKEYGGFSNSMLEVISASKPYSLEPFLPLWFGVKKYLVLKPSKGNSITKSESSFLLSTLDIAVTSTSCPLACFVPVGNFRSKCYQGFLHTGGITINFSSHLQNRIPAKCDNLNAILQVFENHITQHYDTRRTLRSTRDIPDSRIRITYRFELPLRAKCSPHMPGEKWREFSEDDIISLGLHWGPETSPLSSLQLATTWDYFPEGEYIDCQSKSELKAETAPEWEISAHWRSISERAAAKLRNCPLAMWVKSILEVAKQVPHQKMWGEIGTPIPVKVASREKALEQDQDFGGPLPPKFKKVVDDAFEVDELQEEKEPPTERPRCVPFGSLASRLVLEINPHLGIDFIVEVWGEFVARVVEHWGRGELLPAVEGKPDLKCCLLHQKLQLINQCIKQRHKALDVIHGSPGLKREQKEEDLKLNSPLGLKEINLDTLMSELEESTTLKSQRNMRPRGVAEFAKFEEDINIPILQDQPLFTSDMLSKRDEFMASFGSSPEGSRKRSELQSVQLRSDMMSFKAANPGCNLTDFIKWYSPRDCVKGELSARMSVESLWTQHWDSCVAIPAHLQDPIFDFETTGNEVTKWLVNASPAFCMQQIAQIAVGNAVAILLRTPGCKGPKPVQPLLDCIDDTVKRLNNVWRWNRVRESMELDFDHTLNWCKYLGLTETACARVAALLRNAPGEELPDLLAGLVQESHRYKVKGGDEERGIILNYYSNSLKVARNSISSMDGFNGPGLEVSPEIGNFQKSKLFETPGVREFTVVGAKPRPDISSKLVPNRLYVKIMAQKHVRLCKAFGTSLL